MYQHILHELYQRYHKCGSGYSSVTSSHWKTVGGYEVYYKNDRWTVKGRGFGDFIAQNIISSVRFLPQIILSKRLLEQFHCSTRIFEIGKEIASHSRRLFEFDCAKQLLSIQVILQQLGCSVESGDYSLTKRGIKVACVIGDGYGFFSTLLRMVDPAIRVVSVNLGKTLFFDVLFSQRCIPNDTPILLKDGSNATILMQHPISFLEAEHYELLQDLPVDLFINIASMQEMDPLVIERYFEYMRASPSSPVYFYCCNREEKRLPDGTVTQFKEYPWGNSQILLDERCPWYQKFPASYPPLWRPFDGPIRHRLVALK